ncbi:MAG TPA: hypothetical protein VHF47_12735 [Acidimicrobiales bacterium]|nr:hypothetical protein [Acidimicrobiales bacterium]
MAVTEAAKHDLYTGLQETMGEERAATLMELLPPSGTDLATKQDVDRAIALLRSDVTAEFTSVRAEMAAGFKSVRTEMAAEFKSVRTEMAAEFTSVRSEMAAEFTSVRSELKAVRTEMDGLRHELKGYIDRTLRVHTMGIFGFFGIFTSLAVTAVR